MYFDINGPAHTAEPVALAGNPLCVACGRYHGAVNVELRCLRDEVRRLRSMQTSRCDKSTGEPLR